MRKNWTRTWTTRFSSVLAVVAMMATLPTTVSAANTVNPTTDNHTLGTTNGVAITLTEDDGTFTSLTSDGTVGTLVENTHYTVTSGTNFTVLASYLNAQTVSTDVVFTFNMTNGVNPTTTVSILPGDAVVDTPTANHTLGASGNLVVTLTANGRAFTSLFDGSSSLVEATDYTVSGSSYTILSAYLNGLSTGNTDLTFQMDGGNNPTTTVTVAAGDATVSPTTASHTIGSTNEIDVTLTANGRSLTGISDGSSNLVENVDYTVSSDTHTFLADYLNLLSFGDVDLTFAMDGGNNPTTTVTIVENSTVAPTSGAHTLGTTNEFDVTLTLNGNSLSAINDGSGNLVENTDYTVSGGTYTFLADYLNSLSVGDVDLTFQMNAGVNPTSTVTIAAGNATVDNDPESHTLGTANTVVTTLTPNGRTLNAITSTGTGSPLVLNTDYTVAGNVYTILASYLEAQSGNITLTYDMDAGTDPTKLITISAGDATVSTGASHTLGSTNTVEITLDPNGRNFTKISDAFGDLIGGGTDYSAAGNVFTILPDYLNDQTAGLLPLTFTMDGGNNPTSVVTVAAGNATASASPSEHPLGGLDDVVVITVVPNGHTVDGIRHGATVLSEGSDYTDNVDNTYTIHASYLNPQGLGNVVLTIDMSGGVDPQVTVTVIDGDAEITPATSSHTLGTLVNVPLTLKPNGRVLTNIIGRTGADLRTPQDYTVNGNIYTIRTSYLNSQPIGDFDIIFQMNGGISPTNTMTIEAGTPVVSPTNTSHTLGSSTDLQAVLYLNGQVLEGTPIVSSGTAITGTDYSVGGNVYTINADYLNKQTNDITLTFDVTNGVDPVIAVDIVDGDAAVATSPDPASFPRGSTDDLEVTLTLNGRTLGGVTNGLTGLVEGTDYFVDASDPLVPVLTITNTYIQAQGPGVFTLTFGMDGGSNPDVDVTVTVSETATLTTVLDGSDSNPAGGDGSSAGEAIAWDVPIANDKDELTLADVVVADFATFELYDNASFTGPAVGVSVTNALDVGANVFTIKVTAEDATTETFYKVTLFRAASTDASLVSVLGTNTSAVVGGTFDTPASTTVDVDFVTSTLPTNEIVVADNATVRLYTSSAYSSLEEITSTPLALQPGTTHAYIKVTAEDTSVVKYYDVTLNRDTGSVVADLISVLGELESDATVGGGAGSDPAAPITWAIDTAYTTDDLTTGDIVITNGLATLNLYTDSSFATEGNVALVPGGAAEVAYIKVTAQDVSVTNHYAVSINVDDGTDAALTSVFGDTEAVVDGGDGSVGTPFLWQDDVSVLYAVTGLALSDIVASDPSATVQLFSNSDFSTGEITGLSTLSLNQGGTTPAYIKITPQSGAPDAMHYNVTINSQAASTADTLTSVLGLTSVEAVEAGGVGTNEATRITWTFDAADIPFATTTVSRAEVEVAALATFTAYTNVDFQVGNELSGAETLSLDPGGTNSLFIKVTAESSDEKFYEVIMSRNIGSTEDDIVSILGVTATNGLYPGTSALEPRLWDTFNVDYAVTNVGTNDIVVSDDATFQLFEDAAFSSEITTGAIDLDAGVETNIFIKVQAQDINSDPVYHKATMLRSAGDTNAQLTNLLGNAFAYTTPPTPDGATGAGTFGNPYLLSMTVSNAVDEVGLTDVQISELASALNLYSDVFLEESEVTGTNTIALEVGDNSVYVKITAQDPEVEVFYGVTVTRQPSVDAGLFSVLGVQEADASVGSGAGTNALTAITWAITVPYTTLAYTTNDVIGAEEATVDVYTDDSFASALGTNTLDISMDPLTSYIKVTSQGASNILFYAVTISRDGGLEVTPETLTFAASTNYTPLAQIVAVENSSTNSIDVEYVTTYSTNSTSNAWFSLNAPTNFTLAAATTTNLSATVTSSNLAAGTYTATNTFTDATAIPWQVVVTLTVSGSIEDTITISDLSHTYNGVAFPVSVSSLSGSTNIVVTYNGSSAIPVNAGTYAVTATVAAVDNWLASTNTATLEIAKAAQVLTLSGTSVVYDGNAKQVTITAASGTDEVAVTYDGGQDLPIEAGTYAVSATSLEETNYGTGITTGTLTIAKAPKGIVDFTVPSSVQMGETVALSAGLSPAGLTTGTVSFAIINGPGSIDGTNNLTFSGGGTVIVRASSGGEDNFTAAPNADVEIEVIDFAAADITSDFATTHTGVHTLKFNDDGDLYLFYSSADGGMNYAVQAAGTNVFGTNQLIGANSGATLLRSPMDVLFGDTTNIVGQSGTRMLLADMTNGIIADVANSAAVALRNSRLVAGTAPTNHLFVNSGASRVIAYSTTNDWANYTSKDIGSGVLSGAFADGSRLAVFTSSGILVSTNEGASYSTVTTLAAASARGGERAWYAANLKTVNETYAIEVAVNTAALSDSTWSTGWNLVKTHEMGADVVSHIRIAAYENIAILTWQQGDDNSLMYTVTQDHGATWTEPVELISAPTYVRASAAEAGYDIAVAEANDQVRFVLAAGLDFEGIDLSGLTLRATPLQTNVYLRWDAPTTLGAPSDDVMIRVQSGTNAYPTLTTGASIYTGTNQLYIHDFVTADTTYFYGLWVNNGAGYVDPANFAGSKDIDMTEWLYAAPNAAISPASTNYDTVVGGDLDLALTFNGRSVTNVTSSGTAIDGADYTVDGNVYTVLESYLTAQAAGTTVTLTFQMNGGDDVQSAIAILGDATVNPEAVNYQLGSGDVDVTLTDNGRALTAIMNGVATLTESNDYTELGGVYTIKQSYLDGLELGEYDLTFMMDGGISPTTVVTIVNNATISPTTYRYDLGSEIDMDVTLTARGRAVTNITDGVDALVLTTEYTVSSNVYTMLSTYLDTLSLGDNTITFQMDGGDDPQMTVKVSVGSAIAEIDTSSYTLGTAGTRVITLTLNGRTFNSIHDGTKVLVKDTDYTVAGGDTITLLGSYLDTLEPDAITLTLNMDAGTDPTVVLNANAGNASVSLAPAYDVTSNTGVDVTITRNGRSLVKISDNDGDLTPTTHYVLKTPDTLEPVYTLTDAYFESKGNGDTDLTFVMSGGTDPEATVTVSGN